MPKNGKRPTVRQQNAIRAAGLNPHEWLVSKNLPDVLHLIKRDGFTKKVIPA
jgi:hypothetical protein